MATREQFLKGRTMPGVTRDVTGDDWHLRFDSWDAYLRYTADVNPEVPNGSSTKGAPAFCQTRDFGEALDLARKGWQEKRGDVAHLRGRVKADPMIGNLWDDFQPYPTTYHDVAGAFPDVAAFLSGDPNNMIEFGEREEPRSGRVVRIVVDGCYSAGTPTDVVVKRGAVVVALCELLEMLGFSTEIRLEDRRQSWGGGRGKAVTLANIVTVKTAAMPLDVDALMFALAHPSNLRRLGFRANEWEHPAIREAFGFEGGGYGRPVKPVTGKEWDAHVTLESASASRPESMNPEKWIRDIVEGLFREG